MICIGHHAFATGGPPCDARFVLPVAEWTTFPNAAVTSPATRRRYGPISGDILRPKPCDVVGENHATHPAAVIRVPLQVAFHVLWGGSISEDRVVVDRRSKALVISPPTPVRRARRKRDTWWTRARQHVTAGHTPRIPWRPTGRGGAKRAEDSPRDPRAQSPALARIPRSGRIASGLSMGNRGLTACGRPET